MSNSLTEDELRELVMVFGRLGEFLAPDAEPNMEELRQARARTRRQRWRARQLCDDLLRVDPKVRLEEARADKKYRTPAVIHQLLQRSQAEVLNDPKVSRQFAELALAIADGMYPSTTVPHPTMRDLFALGHAQVGNAYRLLSDWPEAQARFQKARELILVGAGDVEIHAHIHHLYGTLLKDQRLFPVALAYLELASADYRQLGKVHEVGLVSITTSVLYRDMGAPDRALRAHIQACELLDEAKAPMLAVAAWKNLAILLCDLGEFNKAATILDNLPTVFETLSAESTIHLNLMWTRGMIACGLGDLPGGIKHYSCVRDGYYRLGNLRSFALVSLDLLRAYYQHGCLAKVEELAEAVYQALKEQPLARETIQALQVLAAATAQKTLVEEALNFLTVALSRNSIPGLRSPTTEP